MERAYYTIKNIGIAKKLPEGTILRFLAQEFNTDTQDTTVVMEVLGTPPKEIDLPQVQFV